MTHWDTPKQLPVVDKSAAAIGGFFLHAVAAADRRVKAVCEHPNGLLPILPPSSRLPDLLSHLAGHETKLLIRQRSGI
jgi:hypothetical protein